MNEEQHGGHCVLCRPSKEKEKELREGSDFMGCYKLRENMILILNMKAKLRRILSRSITFFKTVKSA